MNLHDWIDELCDALDLDAEVDEALLLDLARDVAHAVARPAAPLSAYLLGLAAGAKGGAPAVVEELAERVRALADGWDQPAAAAAADLGGSDDAEDELDGAADPLTEIEDLDDLLGRDPGPDADQETVEEAGVEAGEEE